MPLQQKIVQSGNNIALSMKNSFVEVWNLAQILWIWLGLNEDLEARLEVNEVRLWRFSGRDDELPVYLALLNEVRLSRFSESRMRLDSGGSFGAE